MFTAIFGSVELGVIYAVMALGVYITFRILDFPDLTVDGSFVTGAAVAASMISLGYSPLVATAVAMVAGFVAGCCTGLLHTKGNINALLSGILMMIALYSINLRIMGTTTEAATRPNIPLLNTDSIYTMFSNWWTTLPIDDSVKTMLSSVVSGALPTTFGTLIVLIVIVLIVKLLVDWFLKTEIGLAIRATGDNKRMIRSFAANTDRYIILGLGLSNTLVAFSGALVAQYSKSADVSMGVGMIVIGLASVIIGEAIFGTKTIVRTTMAVVFGAIIYRIVLAVALRIEWLDAADLKLITAIIVILALILPQIFGKFKERNNKAKRKAQFAASVRGDYRAEADKHS